MIGVQESLELLKNSWNIGHMETGESVMSGYKRSILKGSVSHM